MRAVAPVLADVDEVSRRRSITKMLNDELGTSLNPWEWDSWPVEFVETIVSYVTKDVQDGE
jgi:hypothetical protein